jgi:hypothetical protein
MDLFAAIRDLRKERDRMDKMIAFLERRVDPERRGEIGKGASRRGRKSMSLEERREVSDRMRRYWAARRGNATS